MTIYNSGFFKDLHRVFKAIWPYGFPPLPHSSLTTIATVFWRHSTEPFLSIPLVFIKRTTFFSHAYFISWRNLHVNYVITGAPVPSTVRLGSRHHWLLVTRNTTRRKHRAKVSWSSLGTSLRLSHSDWQREWRAGCSVLANPLNKSAIYS